VESTAATGFRSGSSQVFEMASGVRHVPLYADVVEVCPLVLSL